MLTSETLVPYTGGQMGVVSRMPGKYWHTHRGEIKTIILDGRRLKIRLSWFANSNALSWNIVGYDTERRINLDIYTAKGPVSHIRGGECIFLESEALGQEIILYSRGGDKLDPKMVQGFDHALAYGRS